MNFYSVKSIDLNQCSKKINWTSSDPSPGNFFCGGH